MSDLPIKFTLNIRNRDDWWIATSPECPGLYLAHGALEIVLSDVPLAISTLNRLNRENQEQS